MKLNKENLRDLLDKEYRFMDRYKSVNGSAMGFIQKLRKEFNLSDIMDSDKDIISKGKLRDKVVFTIENFPLSTEQYKRIIEILNE
jgi:hypothetical protein